MGVENPSLLYAVHSDSDAADSVAELTETAKVAFTANVLQKLSGTLGESLGLRQ
jgi:hypothetical protein